MNEERARSISLLFKTFEKRELPLFHKTYCWKELTIMRICELFHYNLLLRCEKLMYKTAIFSSNFVIYNIIIVFEAMTMTNSHIKLVELINSAFFDVSLAFSPDSCSVNIEYLRDGPLDI